jgi:cytochrome P450
MMCFVSAAHDPAHFDHPDFDVSRADAELHLAFGKGPHDCLGAALARLEVRIVLELLTTSRRGWNWCRIKRSSTAPMRSSVGCAP